MVRLAFFSLVLVFLSCKLFYQNEPLIYKLQDGNTYILRTDGYYFKYKNAPGHGKSTHVYLLYRNGIIFNANNFPEWVSFNVIEEDIINKPSMEHRKKSKIGWGIIKVNEDLTHTYNAWAPDASGVINSIHYGKVLNDTTFTQDSIRYLKTNFRNFVVLQDTFHFRYFPSKPDSTNQFIK